MKSQNESCSSWSLWECRVLGPVTLVEGNHCRSQVRDYHVATVVVIFLNIHSYFRVSVCFVIVTVLICMDGETSQIVITFIFSLIFVYCFPLYLTVQMKKEGQKFRFISLSFCLFIFWFLFRYCHYV